MSALPNSALWDVWFVPKADKVRRSKIGTYSMTSLAPVSNVDGKCSRQLRQLFRKYRMTS
jgi:hypothetical protein